MSFALKFTLEALAVLERLEADQSATSKLKKVRKALGFLELNARHPGLSSHQCESLAGPNGEPVWESYVENQTPGAWRVWWWYGPEQGQITILTLGPHPD